MNTIENSNQINKLYASFDNTNKMTKAGAQFIFAKLSGEFPKIIDKIIEDRGSLSA